MPEVTVVAHFGLTTKDQRKAIEARLALTDGHNYIAPEENIFYSGAYDTKERLDLAISRLKLICLEHEIDKLYLQEVSCDASWQ